MCAKYHNPSSSGSQAVLQIFCHLHLGHNMCAKYHDPSSSGSPDTCILLTRFHRFTMHKSKKGHNSIKSSKNFMKS